MVEEKPKYELAKSSIYEGQAPFGEGYGTFMLPYANTADSYYRALGLAPEKLVVPREYHQVLQLVYDFYQRGGIVSTVINRLSELAVTDIRNGQRKTTDEQNIYFEAVLHRNPSRLMRFLRMAALEYFLSGMVIPRIEYEEILGRDLHPKLTPGKVYTVPKFDLYPPNLTYVVWVGWGEKGYYLKIPDKDIKLIRSGGSKIKEQQLKYNLYREYYPMLVEQVKNGADKVKLIDIDPILRKEISYSPYPTPFLYNVLEPLIFKQQLRRMDFAVASRVINAILLVKEGNDNYPITEETRGNLDELKSQILARSNNPRLMERLFILFSNHTTSLEWITPDVSAMLDQDKYRQANEELSEGLGLAKILITGESRGGSSSSEVSTWAIQPMLEELRGNLIEWVSSLYEELSDKNKFRNTAAPKFKPIKLQDFVKTAAVYAQLFTEGNISRTSRTDLSGLDFETEVELMKDEKEIMGDLPPFPPMPYSPLPPGTAPGGRPLGSQNVPVNNRNTGVKPKGQKPLSKVKQSEALMEDDEVIDLLIKVAEERGLVITKDTIIETPDLMNE
jgi:hypothetical protein